MWPPDLREGSRVLLADAGVPGCLLSRIPQGATIDGEGIVRVDIALEGGSIAQVTAHGTDAPVADAGTRIVDMDGNMAWPCLVDMHTHLDKGHIWPRAENPDGTF